jgi:hypothetical protein
MDRRTKARRRFHTDRVVAARRARYLNEMSGRVRDGDLDWIGNRLAYGRLADRDPWDCGSRCLLCHGEKLLGAGCRRRREERLWRNDWGA